MITGSLVALVTPMHPDGEIHWEDLDKLVDFHIENGTHGIVAVGTTGESATLDPKEHCRVIGHIIKRVAGRIPVIAGTGGNSTREAIELTTEAHKLGADACLLVVPYYNKPTQEGLYQHYKAINEAVELPIIIYNIPGRSVVDMSVETMSRCYELPNVVGVKDATANLARVSQQRAAMGPGFNQLSGEDATALGFMAHGGHGCISVASNVAPRLSAQFQEACLKGDYVTALTLQDRLMPLHDVMFIETNPSPVKYALSRLGMCSDEARLPLVPLKESSKQAIDAALVKVGLLQARAAE